MTKQKSSKPSAAKTIRNIRRNSRRQYSGEEKIEQVNALHPITTKNPKKHYLKSISNSVMIVTIGDGRS